MKYTIEHFLTKNVFPFPNPYDAWMGSLQLLDYIYYRIANKHKHTDRDKC